MEFFELLKGRKTPTEEAPKKPQYEVVARYYRVDQDGVVENDRWYEFRRGIYGGVKGREHVFRVFRHHPDAKPDEPYSIRLDVYPDSQRGIAAPEERLPWLRSLTGNFFGKLILGHQGK